MKTKYLLSLILCCLFLVNCQNNTKKQELIKQMTTQTSESEPEWTLLSQQNSLHGWHIYQNEDGNKTGWSVSEGVFTFDSKAAQGEGNKSLITDKKYRNFEIKFDWKLSPDSNSGVMGGVSEETQYEHPYLTGPEIQLIDAEIYGDDPKNQIHTTAALYDMIAPDRVMAKKAGEWNSYHITINYDENQGTVVHNGAEINRFPLQGKEWDTMVKNSTCATMDGFGKFKEGHLCLQDHPGVISYKNIKIRRL